mgnify:CR=1 FL=1
MIKSLNKTTVERQERPVTILQFGEGNFLRAFADWAVDVANEKGIMNAGVAICKPRPRGEGRQMIDVLQEQDNIYHVCLEGIEDMEPKREVRLVKCVMDSFIPDEQYSKYEQYITSDELQIIISNTTEAGIRYEEGDDLEALPPKLRKAWLEGDWNVYEGQFFEDFVDRPDQYQSRQWTHVIDPFEIPDGWKIYRSFDWGYNKPFSCAWWAVDYDGVVYRILELYGCTKTPNEGVKWTPPQVFAEIHRLETEHRWLKGKKIQGIADPAIWDAETGESIADVAAKNQVFFVPGDHKRIPGWMQMHYRFAFDENGYPMMYVFSNCKAFIRTIPLLQYDEHKPEDLDTDGEDHVADEVRYFCMSRPIKPREKVQPDKYNETPMAMFLDIPKENIMTVSRRPRMEIIDGD